LHVFVLGENQARSGPSWANAWIVPDGLV